MPEQSKERKTLPGGGHDWEAGPVDLWRCRRCGVDYRAGQPGLVPDCHDKTAGELIWAFQCVRDMEVAHTHVKDDEGGTRRVGFKGRDVINYIAKLEAERDATRVRLAKMDCVLFDPGHGWEADRIRTVRRMIAEALSPKESTDA